MVNRIRELLDARQLSPTQFADLIGVGRPVVSHILSERNKPSLEVVQRIVDAFPDVSLSWLMKGTGSMVADAVVTPAIPATVAPPPPVPPAPLEAVAAVAPALPIPPAPTVEPGLFAQQQYFTSTPQPTSMAPPTPRPLPPKFRPGRTIAPPVAAAPAPAPAAVPPAVAAPTTAPTLTAPANPVQVAPTAPVAAFVAAPPLAPQPALAAPVGFGPTGLAPEHPQAAPTTTEMERPAGRAFAPEHQPAALAPQLAPAAASLVAPGPIATDTPLAVAPPQLVAEVPVAAPNPAAALSFLGEPGKAIRRIVIFYRDGSFSDYVPEGY